jgi:hypothetical protein
MAYSPIALVAPNYRDYTDYWLKAYAPATTTPKIMALDSAASVTVAKLQLNADGFLKSAGGTLVIPYIDGSYDLWLFPTEAEADANDTINAEKLADNITGSNQAVIDQLNINDLSLSYTFKSKLLMVASLISFPVGKKIFWQGYYAESDGGSNWGLVKSGAHTDDGGSIFTLADGKYVQANLERLTRISVKKFGAKGDGSTNDTLPIQNTIDYSEDVAPGSGVSAPLPVVFVPYGNYISTGILMPRDIVIEGAGRTSSVILLEKNSTSLIKRKYSSIATANIAIRNIGFGPDDPATNLPTGQTIFDARGFTKSSFDNVTIYWCGGCNGVSSAEAPYENSSNWYLTFTHCFIERLASFPAGGIGWLIGDNDTAFQQSTTWAWFGGRTSGGGEGTCFNFAGCSTMNLFGHTIEGGDIVVGSDTGDRTTRAVLFHSAYAEAVSSFEFKSSTEICGIFGGRITGVSVVDGGTNNTILLETVIKIPVASTGTAKTSFKQQGSRYLTIDGIDAAAGPVLQFEGASANAALLGPTTDIVNRAFRMFANNITEGIAEFGTSAIRPVTDDALSLGTAARKYSEIFATNGTINTSDEREKEFFDITEAEKSCALAIKKLIKKYKWHSAVEEKGELARYHFGVGAQSVKATFESHGLNPDDYSLICYDEWKDEYEVIPAVIDEEGIELEPEYEIVSLKAGNRYGVRYSELAMFILSSI